METINDLQVNRLAGITANDIQYTLGIDSYNTTIRSFRNDRGQLDPFLDVFYGKGNKEYLMTLERKFSSSSNSLIQSRYSVNAIPLYLGANNTINSFYLSVNSIRKVEEGAKLNEEAINNVYGFIVDIDCEGLINGAYPSREIKELIANELLHHEDYKIKGLEPISIVITGKGIQIGFIHKKIANIKDNQSAWLGLKGAYEKVSAKVRSDISISLNEIVSLHSLEEWGFEVDEHVKATNQRFRAPGTYHAGSGDKCTLYYLVEQDVADKLREFSVYDLAKILQIVTPQTSLRVNRVENVKFNKMVEGIKEVVQDKVSAGIHTGYRDKFLTNLIGVGLRTEGLSDNDVLSKVSEVNGLFTEPFTDDELLNKLESTKGNVKSFPK